MARPTLRGSKPLIPPSCLCDTIRTTTPSPTVDSTRSRFPKSRSVVKFNYGPSFRKSRSGINFDFHFFYGWVAAQRRPSSNSKELRPSDPLQYWGAATPRPPAILGGCAPQTSCNTVLWPQYMYYGHSAARGQKPKIHLEAKSQKHSQRPAPICISGFLVWF